MQEQRSEDKIGGNLFSFHFRNKCEGLKMLLCEGVKANRSNGGEQRRGSASGVDEWMDEGGKGSGCGGAEQYTEAIKRRERKRERENGVRMAALLETSFPPRRSAAS